MVRFELSNQEASEARAYAAAEERTVGVWLARIIRKELNRRRTK